MARKQPGPGRTVKTSVPGIYKRTGPKGTSYVVRVSNPSKGNGGRDDYTVSSWEEAKDLKRKKDGIRRKGTGLIYTVGEWLGDGNTIEGRWFELFPRPKPSTTLHNHERVKLFAREHGSTLLSKVTEEMCLAFNREHPGRATVLRAAFNDAKRAKQIEENPWDAVAVSKGRGRKDIMVLTDTELSKLISVAERVWGDFGVQVFGPMIAVAAGTGCRPGELFALTEDDLDLDAGEVHVWRQWNGRTRRLASVKGTRLDRRVAMLPIALRALERFEPPGLTFRVPMDAGPGESRETSFEPLWVTPREAPFKQREQIYYWPPVRDAFTATLPESHHLQRRLRGELPGGKLDMHELRHFFGTALARAGCTVFEIEDQMGHNDAATVRDYIHLANDDVRVSVRDKLRRAA